eukprot:scaffold103747_cov34-Attheya_sp.AAC.1
MFRGQDPVPVRGVHFYIHAKLSHWLRTEGNQTVLLAACDTLASFRNAKRDLHCCTDRDQSTFSAEDWILAEACCTDRDQSTFSAEDGVRYTGSIECPRDLRVAFVEQEPPSPSDISVSDSLLGVVSSASLNNNGGPSKSVYEAVRRYCQVAAAAEFDEDKFAAASLEMDFMDGWT